MERSVTPAELESYISFLENENNFSLRNKLLFNPKYGSKIINAYVDTQVQMRLIEWWVGRKKRTLIVPPEPAVAKSSTSGPKVVIVGQRKFLFEKTIRFCGYFLPKKIREEAKGDITETRQEMLESGCSKLTVNLISSFKIVCLILSSLRIRWSDWVVSEQEGNK